MHIARAARTYLVFRHRSDRLLRRTSHSHRVRTDSQNGLHFKPEPSIDILLRGGMSRSLDSSGPAPYSNAHHQRLENLVGLRAHDSEPSS
jgi:hypothetical protein